MMQVKDLTIDELKALIKETVMEAISEMITEPDEGLIVRDELKQKLLEIRQHREKGARGISSEEVMHRLGLGG